MNIENSSKTTLIFLLLAVVIATNAFIFDRNFDENNEKTSCIKHCHQDDYPSSSLKYLKFDLNKTYEYQVLISNQILAHIDNETKTNNVEVSKLNTVKQNLIEINADVKLKVLNVCEVKMSMDNVQMKFPNTDRINDHNERHQLYLNQFKTPIIFSYKDGIVTEVCSPATKNDSEIEEDPFVMNVKKSIISALQTSGNILNEKENNFENKVIETDYHGDCETEYQIFKKQSDNYLVKKRKNLLKCSNIEKSSEFSEIGSLIEDSKQAESTCSQLIAANNIIESECQSIRSLDTLLDHFDINLVSVVYLKQKSVEDNNQTNDDNDLDQSSDYLKNIYGLRKSPTKSETNENKSLRNNSSLDINRIVEQLCKNIQQNYNQVNLNTPKIVQQLSEAFQYASNDSIQQIWRESFSKESSNQICGEQTKKVKQIFIDTAASILNENTVWIVRDEMLQLYKNDQDKLARERLRYLSNSLAFAQKPNIKAVQQLVPELLKEIHDPEIVLSISALVKNVKMVDSVVENDNNNVEFLENIYEIIMKQIMELMKNQSETSKQSEIDMARYLQSLANVGPGTATSIQEQLISMIIGQQQQPSVDESNNEFIRFLAIKSLQSVQPTNTVRQYLLKIFSDYLNESNEIRIHAYRTLINTGTSAEELKQILQVLQQETESGDNRDVYNYVCSHQKVLQTTPDLPKRSSLPLDAPEFPQPAGIMQLFLSRHYEYSSLNQKQFGSIMETDVIFSSNGTSGSFNVPRSITFNFTVQIGSEDKQVAVAEVTVRQESLEKSMIKKIMDKIPSLLKKTNQQKEQDSTSFSGFSIDKLMKTIRKEIGEISKHGRMQILINLDGKNVYLFDSKDESNDLKMIWQRLHQQLPIRIDETMVVMPLQKRFHLTQTSSGVPMYFDINATYIGSLEAIIINNVNDGSNQNQTKIVTTAISNGTINNLEIMLKPTIVAQTVIEFDNNILDRKDRLSSMSALKKNKASNVDRLNVFQSDNNKKQFRLTNSILAAPKIHFKTLIQNGQIKINVLLPEDEQTWWHSETKIVGVDKENVLNSRSNFKRNNKESSSERNIETKCSKTMMKYLGVSVCYKNKRSNSVDNDEIVVNYQEIVLQKQNQQMNGIEFILELPEQVLDPVFPAPQSDLKFGLTISEPSSSSSENNTIRFQTKAIVHVPENDHDKLLIDFMIQLLKKKFQGKFSMLDDGKKSMKFELKSHQKNKQMLRINAEAQIEPSQEQNQSYEMNLNFNIDVQPFQGSKVLSGKGSLQYHQPNSKQQILSTNLVLNGQQVLNLAIDQNNDDSYQLSTKSSIDLLGLKLKNRILFNMDEENVKLTSRSSYNRFGSSITSDLNENKMETFDLDYQYSIHNDSEIDRKLFHYQMITSQYPQVNLEIIYNDQCKKSEKIQDKKLILKYGSDFERNQFKLLQTTKTIENVHSRDDVRYETRTNLEFKPKNLQYSIDSTLDLTRNDHTKQQKMVLNIQVHDQKHSQIILKSKINSEQNISDEPFQMSTIGEVQLPKWDLVISFKHDLKEQQKTDQEVNQNQNQVFYLGKFEMTSISQWAQLPSWLPKQFQSQYSILADSNLTKSNGFMRFLTNIRKIEHEIFYENNEQQNYSHIGSIEIDDNGGCDLKALLKQGDTKIYETDVQFKKINDDRHEDLSLQLMLETIRFDHLKMTGEFRWNHPEHHSNEKIFVIIKGKNEKYQHKSFINFQKNNDFEISTETLRPNSEMILNIITSMKSEQNPKDAKVAKFEFRMPIINIEHSSKIEVTKNAEKNPQESKSIELESQTQYKGRNLLKFNMKSQSDLKVFKGEFGGDLRGQLELARMDPTLYQMNLDIHAPQKQIVHQTMARWRKEKFSAFSWNPFDVSYQLLAMDVKNYFGENSMFDVKYQRKNSSVDQQEKYENQLKLSTRLSHGEVSWSSNKAMIVFKTKMFGGIDHQTEFTEMNLPQTMKFISKTLRNDRKFLQLIGDLKMKSGQKSDLEIIIGENQYLLQLEYIPSDKFEANYQSKSGQLGEMKYVRMAPDHFTVNIEMKNSRKLVHDDSSNELRIKLDHKCNQYTEMKYNSKLLQGYLEYRLDKQSLVIDLNGIKNEKFDDFKHKTNAKWNQNEQKSEIKSQTEKSGKKLFSIDADLDPKQNSLKMKVDSNVERLPYMLATLINKDDRHFGFVLHDKRQDKQTLLESRAKNWDDFGVQYAWGPRKDLTKKILLETKAKTTRDSNGNNHKELDVQGQYLRHQLKAKIDKQQNKNGGNHKFQVNYDDLTGVDRKSLNLEHQYDHSGLYSTKVECTNGKTNVLQGNCRLDIRDPKSIDLEMQTKTDLEGLWDLLNTKTSFSHRQIQENSDPNVKNFLQNGSIESGSENQKRTIHLNGNSDSKSMNYQIDYNSPDTKTKTYKLEWNKPERKLQINVFDENGRIVDVNVDVLAKALQKKFQIVSFIDQIPTVDIEAAFGENSHLVFELSFQNEKKLELSMNWFGQWRKDYQAEALFRCLAEPQFEMMIESHHPATFDNIDAVFKYKKREIKATLINDFVNENDYDDKGKWKREAIVEVDGRKTLHLSVDRSKKQQDSRFETVVYNGRLMNNDYHTSGKVQVLISKQDSKMKMIRMQIDNPESQSINDNNINKSNIKHYLIEMFFRYQEQPESTKISGLSVEKDHGEPILIATYVEPANSDSKDTVVNTLGHLLLPGGVDYQMLNQITYEPYSGNQIREVISQLKKRSKSQPLAMLKMTNEKEQNDPGTNVMRIEVRSPNFYDPKPKVLKIRYSLDSMNCAGFGKDEKPEDKNSKRQSCSGMEIIFGDEQAINQKPVSIKFELASKHLNEDDEFNYKNHSILLSMNTLNESNLNRVLNFTIMAHLSRQSMGYKWQNVNRYGNRNFGQFYFGYDKFSPQSAINNETKSYDLLYTCEHGGKNHQQEDSHYRIHFEPKNILAGSYVRTKLGLINLIEKLLKLKTKVNRTEQNSKRSDICEWKNHKIRVLRDEMQYKWRLFKRQTINRDLISAISDEILFARAQMKTSNDPIARKIIEFVDAFHDKFDSYFKQLNLERTMETILDGLDKFLKKYQTKLIQLLERKCFEYEQCRKIYAEMRDYEIRKMIRKNLFKSMECLKHKYSKSFPKPLLNVLKDLNQQQQQIKSQNDFLDQLKFILHKYLNIEDNLVFKLWKSISEEPEKSLSDTRLTNDDFKWSDISSSSLSELESTNNKEENFSQNHETIKMRKRKQQQQTESIF